MDKVSKYLFDIQSSISLIESFQEDSSYTLTHAKQMIDFRNRLIHSYDNIDSSIVWVIPLFAVAC